MSDLDNQLKQCGKPTSEEGKILADKMNEYHYPLTSWGLEMVQISSGDTILDIGCAACQMPAEGQHNQGLFKMIAHKRT
ncbi:MAG: hypothetical protein ACQES4_07700, partial [Bacillota bacterium]